MRLFSSKPVIGFLALVLSCALLAPALAQKPKKGLDPKEVAKNELLDKEFLRVLQMGIKAIKVGNLDGAIKFAKEARKQRPKSGRPMLVMATAYKVKKEYNTAIQYFQQAANRFGSKKTIYEKAQALYNIAFCYELAQNRPNAIAAWQIYAAFAATYSMQNGRVLFARRRINDLQKVKGKPTN